MVSYNIGNFRQLTKRTKATGQLTEKLNHNRILIKIINRLAVQQQKVMRRLNSGD